MRRTLAAACCFALTGLVSNADAQTAGTNRGFEVNRYEPTAAGEWSFAVDHPWYSSLRYFTGGITLNYAHNPLVLGQRSPAGDYSVLRPIIEHRLMGHVDVAGSFADRVMVSFSLPVVLMERGNSEAGVRPIDTAALGDPRIGARFRLLGQPYGSAFSLSLGLDLWIPLNSTRSGDGTTQEQVGETGVRLLPKLMMGGLSHSVMWSFSLGFLYRPVQSIGNIPPLNGNTVGSELQLGFGLKYASLANRLAIGPEVLLSTGMAGFTAFRVGWTSLEALLGVQYNIARIIQLGIAGGVGALREPGTPDGRVLLRLAYAPMGAPPPRDRDRDGIPDAQDACPEEAGVRTGSPATNGCPAAPPAPVDRDGDGVPDAQDLCPGEPAGSRPDPQKPGCPLRDSDGDGVFDSEDQCPGSPAGAHPDPQRPGCPDKDSDQDGIYDGQDVCKEVPSGLNPDPQKPGCPMPDRDRDQIPDGTDACPDKAGSPSPDPRRNGCPGLVEVKAGQIVILQQVFFATGKDEILKKSFPLLDSIVHTLRTIQAIKKIEIEGHTDNKGAADKNIDLSARRARSVQKYLIDHGIAAERLVANGYGPNRPIADNGTEKGRAKNRRVDFRIIDPPQTEAAAPRTEQPPPPAPPTTKKAGKKGAAPPAGKAT